MAQRVRPTSRRVAKKKASKPLSTTKSKRPVTTALPRSFALMRETIRLLLSRWQVFAGLIVVIWSLLFLVVGGAQQLQYESLRDLAKIVSSEVYGGNYSVWVETAVLVTSVVGGGLNVILSEGQQIYTILLYMFTGLVTVWLLRHMVAGSNVRLRDGLYSAGAPIASIVVLGFIAMVQLLPAVLGTLIISSAKASGLLDGLWLSSVFFGVWLLSAVITLYLLMTTFFASIIATIPGTYPITAFRQANRLLAGKRLSVFLRIVWLTVVVIVALVILVAPVIFVDTLVSSEWLPFVAALLQMITIGLSVVSVSYIYVLYRKLIDASTGS